MKILVVGASEPALELLVWLQELAAGKPADDTLGWSENTAELKLEVRHTAKAEEAIQLAREDKYIIFLGLTGIEISPQTRPGINWNRFKHFQPAQQEGAWLLTQIKPSRACKRKVAVITADAKRLRQLCGSLDLDGVIPTPIRPEAHQHILDYLKRVCHNES